MGVLGVPGKQGSRKTFGQEEQSQGHYWTTVGFAVGPRARPVASLGLSVLIGQRGGRKSVPAGMRGSCLHPSPLPGSPRPQAPLQPPGSGVSIQALSASPCRQNQTPVSGKLRPHPALPGMGAPLSPPGPWPHFSSLITFPSGLHCRMDGRSFHTGVAEPGSCVTRSPAGHRGPSPLQGPGLGGQLDQPQHLGTDSHTPATPGHISRAQHPQTLRPHRAPLCQPDASNPPWLLLPGSPHPHTPSLFLPVLTLPDPAGIPHPLRDFQNLLPCC